MEMRFLMAAGASLALLCGCGSSHVQSSSGPRMLRWTASLPPTRNRSESAMTPTELTKAYGSVTLTATEGSPSRSHVVLAVTTPVKSQSLRWAILPGACGANTLPLIGFEAFPLIEVGSSGHGTLESDIPVMLPTEGQYHVNVYFQGQQINDVMTCGALRMEGAR
jgi:hypothetical protein